MRRSRWIGTATAALLCCQLGAARADEAEREAATHYNTGTKAFEDGDTLKAVEELQTSIHIKPSAKAYFQLGNAYTKQGQLDDAKIAFEKYLQLEPKTNKKATVEKLIKELEVLSATALKITSQPAGATIYIDLKAEGAHGLTPAVVAVPPGRHRVMLELEGHEATTIADANAEEGKVVTIEGKLKAKGCDADLRTVNKDTTVQVDIGDALPTPATVRVIPGEHRVRFAGEGLKAKSRNFKCENFQPVYLEEQLESEPTGLLAVHVPSGARVSVNDKVVVAGKNNVAKLPVKPGIYQVDVAWRGHIPWHVDATVRGGEQTDLAPRMEEGADGSTSIEVSPDPQGAIVYVDGKLLPAGDLAPVAAGKHVVEARARGYHDYRHTVDVKPGRSAHLDARLEHRGRWPIALGVAALVLAGGVEATTWLWPHQQASRTITDSNDYNKWHNLEIGGHLTAAVLAGVGVATFVGYGVGRYWISPPDEKAPPPGPPARVSVAPVVLPGGGALSIAGSF